MINRGRLQKHVQILTEIFWFTSDVQKILKIVLPQIMRPDGQKYFRDFAYLAGRCRRPEQDIWSFTVSINISLSGSSDS